MCLYISKAEISVNLFLKFYFVHDPKNGNIEVDFRSFKIVQCVCTSKEGQRIEQTFASKKEKFVMKTDKITASEQL